jgi:uncharacterized RDD family membrane protein YckC
MIAPARAAVGNPFPGLRPFEEAEQHLFFGRESKIDRMIDKLAAHRFLAVVGSSGTGKSSLVNCGLKPSLRRGLLGSAGTCWLMAHFRPGANPTRALALALSQAGIFSEVAEAGLLPEDIIEANLRVSGVGLIEVYRQAQLDKATNLLVIVDQFEELFRYSSLSRPDAYSSNPEATCFVRLLLEAASQREVPIYVTLTMRSDFLGDCAQFDGLPEAISEGQYLVPRMTRDERRAAVEGPIGVAECDISAALLTRLINDVGDNPDQLSILQHALNRTSAYWWNEGKGIGPLSLDHYEAVGTMGEALDRHAERAVHELTNPRQQMLCERIFKAITDKCTDPRGVRRPTTLAALCRIVAATPEEIEMVVRPFRKASRSFLYPPQAEALRPDSVIDISHESLMRIWNRLKKWADEEAEAAREYRRLSDRAEGFYAGRFGLMKDPDLQTALDFEARQQPTEAWADLYGGRFERAIQFLQESKSQRSLEKAEREVERRWQSIWQPLLFGIAALGFLIVLFKYHDDLLPPSLINVPVSVQGATSKFREIATRFLKVSAITLAFAFLYNIVNRQGQKIHRHYILPSLLKGIDRRVTVENSSSTETAIVEQIAPAALWRRCVAMVIDILLGFWVFFIALVLGDMAAEGGKTTLSDSPMFLLYFVAGWFVTACLYQSLFVSSRWQASLGMRALGIYITDIRGRRLELWQVVWRQVVKFLVYIFQGMLIEALARAVIFVIARRFYNEQSYLRRNRWLCDLATKTMVVAGKR